LSILEQWDITPEQLTILLNENPSLRGIMLGYVAELKLRARKFITSRTRSTYFAQSAGTYSFMDPKGNCGCNPRCFILHQV
jgi:hypothetical protein